MKSSTRVTFGLLALAGGVLASIARATNADFGPPPEDAWDTAADAIEREFGPSTEVSAAAAQHGYPGDTPALWEQTPEPTAARRRELQLLADGHEWDTGQAPASLVLER